MTQEGNGNAPFMSIREVIKELRSEVQKMNQTIGDMKSNMVTKAEFEAFKAANTVTQRWKTTTTVAVVAIAVTLFLYVVDHWTF